MRSWLFYIFVFAASYFYNVFNMIQVSERQFFTDFDEFIVNKLRFRATTPKPVKTWPTSWTIFDLPRICFS